MISKLKTIALGGATAVALTFAAGAASAFTVGTIPGGHAGVVNDGLVPVYGAGTTSVTGYYGAQLALLGGSATVTVEYLGAEAGFKNTFSFGGSELFATPGGAGLWKPAAGSTDVAGVGPGLLDFIFNVNGAALPVGSAANGSNIDGSGLNSPANFFVTFNPLGDGLATSGQTVDIWFDDGGAGPDDNHDDMLIRLSVANGSISIVPVPASVPLLLTALGGLGFMARRKRKSA
jgi:hypothetical protein